MKMLLYRNLIVALTTVMFLSGCASIRLPWGLGDQSTDEKTDTGEQISTESNADSQSNIETAMSDPILDDSEQTETQTPVVQPIQEAIPHSDIWSRLRTGFALHYVSPNPEFLARFERQYSSKPEYFQRLADRAYWFLPHILEEVEKRGMPSEIALLPAIESAFRPDATSRARAAGMWQFMKATGKRFGLTQNWWVDNRRDVIGSTTAALDYLTYLSEEFDGDWELALAAYNAGEGRVGRAVKKNRKKNLPTNYSSLDLSKETRQYIPKLIAVRNIIDQPEKYGITLKHIPNAATLGVIQADSQTDLAVVATLSELPMKQLSFLNYNYKRGVTPPEGPHLVLMPQEMTNDIAQKLADLTPRQRLRWARHQVKQGDYLGKIARKHSVTVDSIMTANKLQSHLIKPGQELRIPLSTGRYNYNKQEKREIVIRKSDKTYVVQSGDSLWDIARSAGTDLSSLLAWNTMTKRSKIYPGQVIIIAR